MNNPIQEFIDERGLRLKANANNEKLLSAAEAFNIESSKAQYSYNFSWMGRPIIQYPQDMIAMQEIIWNIKPDLVIETGIAHGGSLIFYASLLELIGKGEVLGIDIDIREHNRKEIEKHPMLWHVIQRVKRASLVDRVVVATVAPWLKRKKSSMSALCTSTASLAS